MSFKEYLNENNAFRGDVNEILLGYHLVGSWDKFVNADVSRDALKSRRIVVDPDDFAEEEIRAKRMAAETRIWLDQTKFGKIKSVQWIGRGPGELSDVIPGAEGSTPADLVLTFSNGKILGISAKSTHQSREIVYRSIGLGQIDIALKSDLVGIRDRAEAKFVERHNLSTEPIHRKEEIKNSPIVGAAANEARNDVLRSIRNKLMVKFSMMPQPKLKSFVAGTLIGMSATVAPNILPYIQVTGHGSGSVTITDPKKDNKRFALQTNKLELKKSGNDSITIEAGGINILRLRIKYGRVPLASPIEVSIDPWTVIGRG